MRRVLRMVTAAIAAWVECVAKTGRNVLCFLVQVGRFIARRRLTKVERALFVLALSMITAGFLVPVESTVVIDFLAGW